MKIFRLFTYFISLFISFHVLSNNLAERYPIIPKPVQLVPDQGTFTICDKLFITTQSYNEETRELISYMADFIKAVWNIDVEQTEAIKEGGIHLLIDEEARMKPEEYALSITPSSITIKASHVQGAFWGFQTLCQLMVSDKACLTLPCVTILDAPRFEYRGLHLDVARHWFPIEFIKKYIDLMASYKFNAFHWHLNDDQGWRIEIKRYPKLQEIAAYRDETPIGYYRSYLDGLGLGWLNPMDGKRYGGYYTQDEIREVVEYARTRHVTVIPEIELPGHCLAALAAYPELGCTGGPYQTAIHWGIFYDVYCAGNEQTFEFLENVLLEVLDLFPSPFIHIGGDEVKKTRWKRCPKCQARIRNEGLKDENELQAYFVNRIEKFFHSKNRRIIGWDEILDSHFDSNAIIMSWREVKGGIQAARQGRKAIMTPTNALYFNYCQSPDQVDPIPIGKCITLKDVYTYDPVPKELSKEQAKSILGAQANVWTEYLKTTEEVEYMVFPRAIALAEVVWTEPSQKDYKDFMTRLTYLKARNVR